MNLPSNSGYVVAAYIVLVLLLLIYLSIMATKLSRVERETSELLEMAMREDRLDETASSPSTGRTPDVAAAADAVADRANAS